MRFDQIVSTIDAHAGGEPLRIITSGLPPLQGDTILARRQDMASHHDTLRRMLLWEPRGHADMYGAVLTPPVTPGADFGVLFLTNEGYSTMCGHGIIALTAALLETGAMARTEPDTVVTYDTPAGLVRARATVKGERVTDVAFRNVPAFRLATGVQINIAAGPVQVDVAFGGAFYALVDAGALGLAVRRDLTAELVRAGMDVKKAVAEAVEILHPEEPDLSFLYGTIISDQPIHAGSHGRNVTIYADGAVDRSPCGTGTSAKLTALFARGDIRLGEPYVHESITDSMFTGRVLEEVRVGDQPAVVTEIAGRGFVTGFHQFVADPEDPTRDGFLVR
ncbi:MAG: proline racemase family protein [Chloroflexota bacterium]|nr:proline racemase family protein [Chloroflexota bacterium]